MFPNNFSFVHLHNLHWHTIQTQNAVPEKKSQKGLGIGFSVWQTCEAGKVKLVKLSLLNPKKRVCKCVTMWKGPTVQWLVQAHYCTHTSCFNCVPLSHAQWFLMHVNLVVLANFCSVLLRQTISHQRVSSWLGLTPWQCVYFLLSLLLSGKHLCEMPLSVHSLHTQFLKAEEAWQMFPISSCFQEVDFFAAACTFLLPCFFAE